MYLTDIQAISIPSQTADNIDAPVVQPHHPAVLDLLLPRTDRLLEVCSLDAQPLDLARPCLDLLLDLLNLRVNLLELIAQSLHLLDLLIEFGICGGDSQARVRVCLAEAGQREAGIQDLAGQCGSFLCQGAGFVVVCKERRKVCSQTNALVGGVR